MNGQRQSWFSQREVPTIALTRSAGLITQNVNSRGQGNDSAATLVG